jgi:hypothetical protein
MTVLAPDPVGARPDADLLIREARRRQRRRRLVGSLIAAAAIVASLLVVLGAGSRPRSRSLLARPLHFPPLGRDGRCPVSSGRLVSNSYFAGPSLGRGPVRLLLATAGDVTRGRVELGGATSAAGWFGLQTLWYAMPDYNGPFVVRGARLGATGQIAVQPDYSGLAPGQGPLVVPAGATANTYYTKWRPGHARDAVTGRLVPTLTGYGYRTQPGSTWVRSPGCYAWQVDGRGFSETIVVKAGAGLR